MAVVGTVNVVLGIGWPWTQGQGGLPPSVADQDAIKANLLRLYSTQPGDDKTAPEFGTDLLRFVFATTGSVLDSLVAAEIHRATAQWEPRVTIDLVTTDTTEDPDGTVIVDINVDFIYLGMPDSVLVAKTQTKP